MLWLLEFLIVCTYSFCGAENGTFMMERMQRFVGARGVRIIDAKMQLPFHIWTASRRFATKGDLRLIYKANIRLCYSCLILIL